MSDPFAPRVGGILSADIAVPEHEREVRFYSRILTTGENPLWREDLMNSQGSPIIGLGKRIPEYSHLPLQWMPHIQAADVAASVKRTLELGGSVLMHDEKNQWAVLLDPNGAAFGIMPVVSAGDAPKAAGEVASVGRICSVALAVSDASATRDFYREVVGWSVKDVEMQDASVRYADFDMFDGDGCPAARVSHARGVNSQLPPVWILHLPVGDLAESVRRAQEAGGKIIKATRESGGSYAGAVVEDLVGAYVALVPG